jgi:hypothetical protein
MANFKFLGDPRAMGKPIIQIKLHDKNGAVIEHNPPNAGTEWQIDDILENITCPRCIRHLRADPRFMEI